MRRFKITVNGNEYEVLVEEMTQDEKNTEAHEKSELRYERSDVTDRQK